MAATRLTGVTQAVRGEIKLKKIYNRILHLLDKVPREAAYRINTEAIICHRLSILNQTDDIQEIEDTICCGRIEMLIVQAKEEYLLCQHMISAKPWESLVQKPPPGQWTWPPVCK